MKHQTASVTLGILLFSFLLGIEVVFAEDNVAKNPEIAVGIIQRFGVKPLNDKELKIDRITIDAMPGEFLNVRFLEKTKSQPSLKTKQVVFETQSQAIDQKILSERLVLSDRSTFETAEASAQSWRKLGIEVEITQPGRWQVWAKRDVYSTPLVLRWLLNNLQTNGYDSPRLESSVLDRKPQSVLKIDGQEYRQDRVEITTDRKRLKVTTISENQSETNIYGGSLQLQPNAYGDYTLVNRVPLETYLRGVVPYEIGADAPKTAIAAQAIVARTYALRNLRRFAADDYQLCATVHCQVYKGLNDSHVEIDRAIAATQGLVLTYQNELIDALYSSTSGGVTAYFSDVWNGEERPYLKPIIDATQTQWDLERFPLGNETVLRQFLTLQDGFNETGRTAFRWHKISTIANLNRDLRRYLQRTNDPLADFTSIESLKVQQRSPSGRILTLIVKTDRGLVKLYKNEIRSAFEPPRSTLFYLEPIYNARQEIAGYAFIGGGFGHGVGLSQYGAHHLANLGWTAEKILTFYYPNTTLQLLTDSIIFNRQ
jgi:SpoIID/LytB domain protein